MKSKRIFALVSALLLIVLYGSTIIFALLGNPASNNLLMASLFCTFAVPMLLFAFQLVYRNQKMKNQEDPTSSEK